MKRRGRPLRLTKREIEVCDRARQARDHLGLTQSSVAQKLQISRARWTSIEVHRAPLTWFYGVLFCMEFGVSIKWLATNTGEMVDNDVQRLPVNYTLDPPNNMAFGMAYDKFLAVYFSLIPGGGSGKKSGHGPAPAVIKLSKAALPQMVSFWLRVLPDEELQDFVRFLWRHGEEFRRKKAVALLKSYQSDSKDQADPLELFGGSPRQ